MCECLDGRVVKALDLRSNVHLHAWVRILLLVKYLFKLEKVARAGPLMARKGPFQKYTLYPHSPLPETHSIIM